MGNSCFRIQAPFLRDDELGGCSASWIVHYCRISCMHAQCVNAHATHAHATHAQRAHASYCTSESRRCRRTRRQSGFPTPRQTGFWTQRQSGFWTQRQTKAHPPKSTCRFMSLHPCRSGWNPNDMMLAIHALTGKQSSNDLLLCLLATCVSNCSRLCVDMKGWRQILHWSDIAATLVFNWLLAAGFCASLLRSLPWVRLHAFPPLPIILCPNFGRLSRTIPPSDKTGFRL